MGINMSEFRNRRQGSLQRSGFQKSAGFWKPPEGVSLVYICPPGEGMDGIPYIEFLMHYRVGPNLSSLVCLDRDNTGLWNDHTIALLAKRKEPITEDMLGDHCPMCAVVEGDVPYDPTIDVGRMERRNQYLFGVIPWAKREDGKVVPLPESERIPRPMIASWTVWDGICGAIEDAGDVTDPDVMVLIKIERKGEKKKTRYSVGPDTATVRNPIRLPKSQRVLLRKVQESDGDLDLYRIIASMTKSHADCVSILQSGEVETREVADESKPHCFGEDFDEGDDECLECDYMDACRGGTKVEPPKPKRRPKPKQQEMDLEEEEPEEEEMEEEPEPPPVAKKKRGRPPKAKPVEEVAEEKPKRKRGRPPKKVQVEEDDGGNGTGEDEIPEFEVPEALANSEEIKKFERDLASRRDARGK